MKIEFVKEVNLDGSIFYSTEVDGQYFSGSGSSNEQKAREMYKKIVSGKLKKKEILETTEISTYAHH